MRFFEFFRGSQKEKQIIEKNDPEILLIDIDKLNEQFITPLKEIIIERHLSETEKQSILEEITSTYSNFPEEVKELFRYKTLAIYFLPYECNFSGLTVMAPPSYDKAFIIINAKTIKRGIFITLLHELGHCLDFNTYPPMYTPSWAWKFLDKFENDIIRKEPEPLEGFDRDEIYLFGEHAEEWASRLAATIIAIYFSKVPESDKLPVTGLRKPPLTVDEFKRKYPRSYKFFRKFLKVLNKKFKEGNK